MRDIFNIRVWIRGDEAGFQIGWVWVAIIAILIWWLT